MLHKILNLEGIEILKKEKQKTIKGGEPPCPVWVCNSLETWPLQPACYCD
ncbi:hypothetical protein [Aquimarina sp. BL5]|nr:hypothetical protein [Aquimarina sp. BL5]